MTSKVPETLQITLTSINLVIMLLNMYVISNTYLISITHNIILSHHYILLYINISREYKIGSYKKSGWLIKVCFIV